MDDGFGLPTPEDIRLEAHVRLTAADGTEIAVVQVDQLLRGVLLECDPNGADDRMAMHFYGLIVSRLRARLSEFVNRLRPRQPANAYFARIDEFLPERGHLHWIDPPQAQLDQDMVRRIDRALMELHHRKLDLD